MRRLQCREGGDAERVERGDATYTPVVIEPKTKDTITDDEILDVVKDRELGGLVVDNMTDEEFAAAMRRRDVVPLIEARASRLIHELRRQLAKSTCEAYYGDKKDDLPTCSNAVGAVLDVIHEPASCKVELASSYQTGG